MYSPITRHPQMYMYVPVCIDPATLGRNLLVHCRWESIAANMFDCQVYAVSVRIRRLDLIGEISMAPRMEPNFIALPVYQITNHPDT